MASESIYRDVAERTNGEIFIGVVGPVRSGKSTFIKKFMESAVIPNIENEYDRQRARDELPQSAGGRTVMTTEPKFVPDEAVRVTLDGNTPLDVRLIDCVGYLIPGILGDTEEGTKRLVHTPWSKEPVPFEAAAEDGTRRVIADHSTVGILVTCDGTIGDLPRENYVEAEERIVRELTELGKPFAVVLNSADPGSPDAERLALSLEEKNGAPVAPVNCLDVDAEDVEAIMKLLIPEFPVKEISVDLPSWMTVLDGDHWLKKTVTDSVTSSLSGIGRMCDVEEFCRRLTEKIKASLTPAEVAGEVDGEIEKLDMSCGNSEVILKLPERMFYRIIGEQTGISVDNEAELLSVLRQLSKMKAEYEKYADAINDVNERGYGIVLPDAEDLTLDEPEIVRQSGGYGIKLRASAPSIHMIKAGIETELSPIVGTEAQSEELVKYLLDEFRENPSGIWETNLFGKSIYELVNEGLHSKLGHLPEDAREKLGETLSKVVNEGAGGLICIIL